LVERATYNDAKVKEELTDFGPVDLAVYAGDALNPAEIADNLHDTKLAGWTTILLGLFHVGEGGGPIFFNNLAAIDIEVTEFFKGWQKPLNELLEERIVRRIYASFGGGDPVRDFSTIANIYYTNNHSFFHTPLEFNLKKLREAFPAITGIDMDVEEAYDRPSFIAFCQFVRGMGFDISFCPFGHYELDGGQFIFWIKCLQEIEQSSWGKGAVKCFNLQCYWDATYGVSPPEVWAYQIKKLLPDFNTEQFINIGCWARFYNDKNSSWEKSCPSDVQETVAAYKERGKGSVGGAFIWTLDYILQTSRNPSGCNGYAFMGDYTRAIWAAMVT
jgi:hypothetical protein